MTSNLNSGPASELMTLAQLIAHMEQERDALDEAIRTMRAAARIIDRRVNPVVPATDAPMGFIKKPEHDPDDDRKLVARRLYEDNTPVTRIAATVGVSPPTVYDWARRLEWKRPPKLQVVI